MSAAALLIAWWQLVLQRDAAGGRGIIFEVHRPHHKEARIGGEVFVTDEYYVLVKLVGNDLHEAAVHLERHGRPLQFGDRGYIDETPETLHRFTCEDEPLIWEFELSPHDARDLCCVLSWVAPYGPGVRTNAFRRALSPPFELEQWHWFRSFRARTWVQGWGARRRWRLIRRVLSRPRRVGEWRPVRGRELQPGQSPMYSRASGRDGG
ncbi:hypothetical protein [Mycobacterium bourgelatii]|uniref:hypothetical protein n=1 Tax=Mycobacterium bourgelatii TaxID=1273442 RepID=UPI001962E1F0|nr:hypothetical protein [Mycobacterium bourgelatii]MCV6978121.1 hypothetical protein [Mycobacterium bourgelatii]